MIDKGHSVQMLKLQVKGLGGWGSGGGVTEG
jgi:hypothetical protein